MTEFEKAREEFRKELTKLPGVLMVEIRDQHLYSEETVYRLTIQIHSGWQNTLLMSIPNKNIFREDLAGIPKVRVYSIYKGLSALREVHDSLSRLIKRWEYELES